jgi:sugar phosphate permease
VFALHWDFAEISLRGLSLADIRLAPIDQNLVSYLRDFYRVGHDGDFMHKTQRVVWGSVICTLAALFYVYDYFIQVAPSVMVNDLMRDFHIGAGDLGVLSACFFYSYAVMQIPAGWTLDRLGPRRLLSLAVLVSALGVILFSQAPTFTLACVGRFMIGLGSAFAFISTLFLLSQWFSHKNFATLAGFVQLGACVGSIIGLAPIAILVNNHGWRETMLITGLLTLVLVLVFWLVIRDRPQGTAKIAAKQRSLSHKAILKNKQVWLICACGFFSWIPVAGIGALWGVPYMMKVYNLSNTQAGTFMTWFWLGIGLGSPLIGWLSHRLARRKLPIIACFMCAVVGSGLLLDAPHLSMATSMFALFILGFSASTQSLTFGVLKDVVPQEQFGFASGMNNMAAIIGGGLAQPLIGVALRVVWNGQYANGVPVYTLANYQTSLYLLPVLAVIGMLVASRLRETHCVLGLAQARVDYF